MDKKISIVIIFCFKICFSQSDSILKYQPCNYDSINFNQFIRKYNEIELPITFSKKYIKSISKKLGTKKYELIAKQHICFLPGFSFREANMYANFMVYIASILEKSKKILFIITFIFNL
ncbi:MAG: hypothetical protein EAZ53_01160 [Bacteroidetes bacterium]|nr:MAG: hypothetical protein EAZ53_01160 [Bacteroidota bacterium]